MSATSYLFVGEKPSPTAYRNGWSWESGRLAASTLFDALSVAGVCSTRCGFTNLYGDHPDAAERLTDEAVARAAVLAAASKAGVGIVALGQKVARDLRKCGIDHIVIRHPAARGAGRLRSAYRAHVLAALSMKEAA